MQIRRCSKAASSKGGYKGVVSQEASLWVSRTHEGHSCCIDSTHLDEGAPSFSLVSFIFCVGKGKRCRALHKAGPALPCPGWLIIAGMGRKSAGVSTSNAVTRKILLKVFDFSHVIWTYLAPVMRLNFPRSAMFLSITLACVLLTQCLFHFIMQEVAPQVSNNHINLI